MIVNYEKLSAGSNLPHEVNVLVEVPMNAEPTKYEFNSDVGVMFVDRFIHTGMRYPCNYGFIPNTLSGDGDPVDVLVYANYPIISGAVVTVRPLGVLLTEDEKGQDEKILAVPITKLDPFFEKVKSYLDLPESLIQQINHFFTHYKALEKGKWVNIKGWEGVAYAQQIIQSGAANFKAQQHSRS